ncbi:MAG: beta-RFAP synthase [Planctomycetes bacterium]|nr:beta-RFAP synthase [Planctomycetota bacterium]
MTRVVAPARLHFGLLSLPIPGDERQRQFGGVGLMIDSPSVALFVEAAAEWSSNSARALDFARTFSSSLTPAEQIPFQIVVEQMPEEHAGLGSGTALALAVAQAIAIETSHRDWSSPELARRVGRGRRSAIGVHGFERGGLIFEQGKMPGEEISPLVEHRDFPADWRIVLLRPHCEARWYGRRELLAFEKLTRNNPTDELRRLAVTGLLPAVASVDIDTFGDALFEFNARAGEGFRDQQGGVYAGAEVADLVAFMRQNGVRGVGQSSWGPTVFALASDEKHAAWIETRVQTRFAPGVEASMVARASAHGRIVG